MFGMSREERRRLDAAEKLAGDGKDLGNKALAEISKHAGECNVREQNRQKWQGDVDSTLRWVNRQGILMLLAILGAILLGIAEHKGLF